MVGQAPASLVCDKLGTRVELEFVSILMSPDVVLVHSLFFFIFAIYTTRTFKRISVSGGFLPRLYFEYLGLAASILLPSISRHCLSSVSAVLFIILLAL